MTIPRVRACLMHAAPGCECDVCMHVCVRCIPLYVHPSLSLSIYPSVSQPWHRPHVLCMSLPQGRYYVCACLLIMRGVHMVQFIHSTRAMTAQRPPAEPKFWVISCGLWSKNFDCSKTRGGLGLLIFTTINKKGTEPHSNDADVFQKLSIVSTVHLPVVCSMRSCMVLLFKSIFSSNNNGQLLVGRAYSRVLHQKLPRIGGWIASVLFPWPHILWPLIPLVRPRYPLKPCTRTGE
jgi:hypothetical protein